MTTTPVKPGTKRWKELVTAGIVKDADRNWFLGDAALEIAPMGDDRANNGAIANLRQYADEIGVDAGSLRVYRQVASAWPHENRISCAWKVHQQLMNRQELIRPGMTVTEAHKALGHSTSGRTGPEADVADRAASVREYLADPDVADAVVEDPAARSMIRGAVDDYDERTRHPKPEPVEETPSDAVTVMLVAYRRLQRAMTDFGTAAAKPGVQVALRNGEVKPLLEWLRNAIDLIESAAGTGESIDEEFARLTGEGGDKS